MLIWWALRIWTAYAHPEEVFPCDPVDGPRIEWTAEQRKATRELARIEWRRKGASGIALAFLDSAGERESGYAPSRRHDGNTGLGMHGMSIRYFGGDGNMCDPRDSAFRFWALSKACTHMGNTPWDLQACVAGRFECTPTYKGPKTCTQAQQDRTTEAICGRMERRGYSCHGPITRKDLGL